MRNWRLTGCFECGIAASISTLVGLTEAVRWNSFKLKLKKTAKYLCKTPEAKQCCWCFRRRNNRVKRGDSTPTSQFLRFWGSLEMAWSLRSKILFAHCWRQWLQRHLWMRLLNWRHFCWKWFFWLVKTQIYSLVRVSHEVDHLTGVCSVRFTLQTITEHVQGSLEGAEREFFHWILYILSPSKQALRISLDWNSLNDVDFPDPVIDRGLDCVCFGHVEIVENL